MVRPDVYNDNNKNKTRRRGVGSGHYVARPLDRLAAQVFDLFVILYPLVSLFTSGILRVLDVTVTVHDEAVFGDLAVILMVVCSVTVILYQTILITIYGTTMGKRVMGLKVVKLWSHEKPSFFESFLRALLWGTQCLFAGLPFLSVIANHKHRGLHDRISETIVVTDRKKKASRGPNRLQLSFVKGMHFVWISFLVVYLFAVVVGSVVNIGQYEVGLISLNEESGATPCDVVSQKRKKWNTYKVDQPHRLLVAMTLFTAGEIDEECLDSEADYALQLDENKSLAYLAKSFTTATKPELSNSYLDRVCSDFPESDDCMMSQVVNAWYQKDFDKVNKLFRTFNNDSKPDYLKVWGLYQFYKVGQYSLVLDLADGIKGQRALANILLPLKVRALWGLSQVDHARDVFSNSVNFVEEATQWDMASWMCFEETLRSCEFQEKKSCEYFNGNLQSSIGDDQQVTNLALINQYLCKGKPSGLFSSSDPKINDLYEIVTENQFKKKKSELLDVIFNTKEDLQIRKTALNIFLHNSTENKDFDILLGDWKQLEDDASKLALGIQIYQGLYAKEKYRMAYSLKLPVFKNQTGDQELNKQFVVTAFKTKHHKEAISRLDNLNVNESRVPASVTEYERVKRELVKEILK